MPETETVTNAPICKTQLCKRPLTYLEDSKCWRCLICNPLPKDVPKFKEVKKFLDVAMTEERVKEILTEQVIAGEERIREIVQDELENWHIQKPTVTKTETDNTVKLLNKIVDPPLSNARIDGAVESGELITREPEPLNWRQEAKELGIPLFQRKKADVLAEIDAKKHQN